MTHFTVTVTLIVGLLTIVGIVGGFGISLLRRWWNLEDSIKASMERDKKFKKRDQKLKKNLRMLVEQKLSDHSKFEERLNDMQRTIDALQDRTARR